MGRISVLDQYVISAKVAMSVMPKRIIVKPVRTSRRDMGVIFLPKAGRYADDQWFVPDEFADGDLDVQDWYEQ